MKKKHIIILSVIAALFVILLTLALLGKFAWGWFDDDKDNNLVARPIEDGEDYYYIGSSQVNNVVLMYSQITRTDIAQVRVHNSKGDNYFFYHTILGNLNYFSLGQCDNDNWEWTADDLYYPSILQSFSGAFDYTSLYDDQSTLPAMLAAVGTVMIDERIKPGEGESFNQEFLSRYGLSKADHPAYFEIVMFMRDARGNYIYVSTREDVSGMIGFDSDNGKYYYITENGTRGEEYPYSKDTLTPAIDVENTKRVYVGHQTIDDTGYYLYLEGRNVVYTVQGGYLSDVVGRNMGYYVAPRLVTQAESAYAPQLSPFISIENGKMSYSTSTIITSSMSVGLNTNQIWIVDSDNTTSGGNVTNYNRFELIDLTNPKTNSAILQALIGRKVGDKVDILVPSPNLSQIGASSTYYVRRVMGVMTSNGYDSTAGYQVQAGDKLIIAYADGRRDATDGLAVVYGYVDLSDSRLTQAHLDALVGLEVGKDYPLTSDGVKLDFAYDETAEMYQIEIQLQTIDVVKDRDGNSVNTIDYGTTVTMSYVFVEDGVRVGEYTNTLKIPARQDMDEEDVWVEMGYDKSQIYTLRTFFEGLIGKSVGTYVNSQQESTFKVVVNYPMEVIYDFTLYQGAEVEFVTSYEEIITFGHTNDRNVFHGTNTYEIMSPSDKVLYGIDANSVLNVLQYFENLIGDETVAVGLNTETMREYGLYAYKLVYELPFECYTVDAENGKTHYKHKSSITFTLYISEKAADGSRYVGCDQYDLVARVNDGSVFDFVEWDFYAKWMQNNLLMVGYQDLRGMVFDLNFTEEEFNRLIGLELNVDRQYPIDNGDGTYDYVSKLYASLVDGGKGAGNMTYEEMRAIFQYIITTNSDDYSEIPYESQMHISASRYIETISDVLRHVYDLQNGTNLDDIYGNEYTYVTGEKDGTYSVKKLLYLLDSICYFGEVADDLSEEEKQELLAGEYSMAIALTLCDESGKQYGYTLRFYNYSGHSLVSITDERSGENTDLFYIQTHDVMKIAQVIVDISEGKIIDLDKY